MGARLRARLTYANAMSTIALFVALGGVSYAATQLPPGSVGTKQLRDHAVTGRKVSPPLFESLEILGRDSALARLDRFAAEQGLDQDRPTDA